jgi:pyoverdine/dityrosine biosynthesis protein Dit1
VKAVYTPGCQFVIYMDGEAICDPMSIPLNDVYKYEDDVKTLA